MDVDILLDQYEGINLTNNPRKLLCNDQTNYGWFYIKVKSFINNTAPPYIFKNPNIFQSKYHIRKNIYMSYLTSDQKESLMIENEVDLISIINLRNKSLLETNKTEFFIKSISNWFPKDKNIIFKKIGSSFYVLQNVHNISSIYYDPEILKIEECGYIKYVSRFNSGFIQGGADKLTFEKGKYRTNRILENYGLTGNNQVITFVDTGIDINSTYFHDDVEVIPNTTIKGHRKIARLDSFGENDIIDNENGHGTWVAGIAAGKSHDPDSPASLYDGMAPNAKIYMIDKSDITAYDAIFDLDTEIILNHMSDVNSKIWSNSWILLPIGGGQKELSELLSELMYENPDILIIFPTGDIESVDGMAIFQPSDSKNVLTVGGINPIYSMLQGADGIPFLVSGEFKEVVNSNISSEFAFENIEFTKTAKEGKVCIVTSEKDCKAFSETCLAVLHDNICTDIPNSISPNSTSFESLASLDRASLIYDVQNTEFDYSMLRSSAGGPTQNNLKKPEVVAPYISFAARSKGVHDWDSDSSTDSVIGKGGTSSGVPIVAGAAALARQYFEEGFYPKLKRTPEDSINPSSALLKAILVNSAQSLNGYHDTSIWSGHGFPRESEALGLGSNPPGVRFIDRQNISQFEHQVFTVTTDKQANMSITLSYLDPPGDYAKGLMADINLHVVTPNQKVITGNMMDDGFEEQFSTIEKIKIENAEAGEYQIHVIMYSRDNISVNYSLAVSGGFDTTDIETNPLDLEFQEAEECINNCSGRGGCDTGICICNEPYLGDYCQIEATTAAEGTTMYMPQIESSFVRYTHFSFPAFSTISVHEMTNTDGVRPSYFCLCHGFASLTLADCFEHSLEGGSYYTLTSSGTTFAYIAEYSSSNAKRDLLVTILGIDNPNASEESSSSSAPETDSASQSDNAESSESDKGGSNQHSLSNGEIVAIASGCFAGVAIIAFVSLVVFFVVKRRRRRSPSSSAVNFVDEDDGVAGIYGVTQEEAPPSMLTTTTVLSDTDTDTESEIKFIY